MGVRLVYYADHTNFIYYYYYYYYFLYFYIFILFYKSKGKANRITQAADYVMPRSTLS